MRLFIAFPVGEEAKAEIVKIQEGIKKLNPRTHVTWSREENMHVTLAFLGEVEDARLEDLKNILRRTLTGKKSFNYWLQELDGFPSPNHPHILVVRAEEEKRESVLLREEIAMALKSNGFLNEDEHAWQPHVTLGRVKKEWRDPVGLYTIKTEKKTWKVEEVILFKSELHPQAPVYTALEKFKLN